MSLPFKKLTPGQPAQGIGGFAKTFDEPAVIMFEDGKYLRLYGTTLSIAKPTKHNKDVPSLLGQDILKNWRMVHDKPRGQLSFTAQRAGFRVRGDFSTLAPESFAL